jgi:Spy/CpxP family protein refolding chaperone
LSTSRFLAAAALAATLVLPAAAFAQQGPPAPMPATSPMPGHRHGHHGGMRRMMQTLNLSAAQKQQIDAAFAQSKAANQNVTDPAARQANRAKLHAQIEAILTPAQRTQLQAEMQKMHRGRGQDGHGPDRDGHGPMPVPSASPRA